MDFDLKSKMRKGCFLSKGWWDKGNYVYEWKIPNNVTVYVGRGVGRRSDQFYTTQSGSVERDDFVRAHKHDLICRYAVFDVSFIAAKEAEAILIAHYGLSNEKKGGTLLNERLEMLPTLDNAGDDRQFMARFNIPASTPPADKCLINGEFITKLSVTKDRRWQADDLIGYTGQANPFWTNARCWHFDDKILRRNLPATYFDIIKASKEYDFADEPSSSLIPTNNKLFSASEANDCLYRAAARKYIRLIKRND